MKPGWFRTVVKIGHFLFCDYRSICIPPPPRDMHSLVWASAEGKKVWRKIKHESFMSVTLVCNFMQLGRRRKRGLGGCNVRIWEYGMHFPSTHYIKRLSKSPVMPVYLSFSF